METLPNNIELAKKLQGEVQKSKCFKAICELLAGRERDRNTLTVSSVRQNLFEKKLQFSGQEYTAAFETIVSLGIATAMQDDNGRLVGLKNIKIPLKALGKAALAATPQAVSPKQTTKALPLPKTRSTVSARIITSINNKPIDVTLEMSPNDLWRFVQQIAAPYSEV